MSNEHSRPISIRLDASHEAALDRLCEQRKVSRTHLIREALDLLLLADGQARMLRDAIHSATADALTRMRDDAKTHLADMLDLARVTDETHRQLLADFLDALASADGGTAQQKPHANSSGKVAMPPRPER